MAPSVQPSTQRPSAASLSKTTTPTQSGTDKVPPAPNITLDISMGVPDSSSSPSLSSSPTSSPLNETTTTVATFSTTQVDKEDDGESEESTTTIATTSSSTIDDLWSNDIASVVIDLGGTTSEGLNDTNSSINGMNDTESTDDEGSNSTEQKNIPTSAPQSSTLSANKELDQTNNTGTTQEKETLSAGATAGIVIAILFLLGLAAYLIHRRREQKDQASLDSPDEEAGLELDDDGIDIATRDDVSTSNGFEIGI